MPTSIEKALEAIDLAGGRRADYARRLNGYTALKRQQINAALSLSDYNKGIRHRDEKTLRRKYIRAILLVKIMDKGLALTNVAVHITPRLTKPSIELQRELKNLLPIALDLTKRDTWAPRHFTNPKHHDPDNYRYIIHGLQGNSVKVYNDANTLDSVFDRLQRDYTGVQVPFGGRMVNAIGGDGSIRFLPYREYLRRPQLLHTDVISCSVISDQVPDTYTDFGLILKVPRDCVMLTGNRDLNIKNRASDMLAEFETYGVDDRSRDMMTPNEILQLCINRKAGVTDRSELNRIYNEIVCVGTSTTGKQVTVTGIFVKVNEDGDYYSHFATGGTYNPVITDDIEREITRSSLMNNIPIIRILAGGGLRKPSAGPITRSRSFSR